MTIVNTGATACTLDAGSANLELVVASGADRIWSSDDCQKASENQQTSVAPGVKLESKVAWSVVRSASGCPTGLAKLKPGTYQLTARVGDFRSQPLALTVTG